MRVSAAHANWLLQKTKACSCTPKCWSVGGKHTRKKCKCKLHGKKRGKSKYNAKPTVIDGIRFASKHEATRYQELKIMQRCGEVSSLELQPKFPIRVNDVLVCTYFADFRYINAENREIVEDAKGFRTDVFKLKKKLVKACYGIDIVES